MKKKVCIFSGSRSEYGILHNLIINLEKNKLFDLHLLISGSHLNKKYGSSFDNIRNDKIKNTYKIDINLSKETSNSILESISFGFKKFKKTLIKIKPDIIIVLGDRYELLPIVISSFYLNIPIAHIHGGEKTYGSQDDSVRHAVTKFSNYHFVANQEYKRRVIQLGENPKNIYNVGSLSIENINKYQFYSLSKIKKLIKINNLKNTNYFLVALHPYKQERKNILKDIKILLNVLENIKNISFIFTYPNHDINSDLIINEIVSFNKNHNNSFLFKNLGRKLFLSVMKNSLLLIGNSSSGIIEAPSLNIPVINLGNRQNGRLMSNSIINCNFNKTQIKRSIKKAISKKFLQKIGKNNNPYYKKNTVKNIINILNKIKNNITEKSFYDL